MENNYKIYCLKEPDTELVRYIGLTGCSIEKRFKEHIKCNDKSRRRNWIYSLKSKGVKPTIGLIEDGLNLKDACNKEIEYIKLFKSVGAILVNSAIGGQRGMTGYKHSEETKRKQSESRKGTPAWNKGIPASEEAKIKLSESKKGQGIGNKHRQGKIPHNKGVSLSEDAKKNLSELNKGKLPPNYNKSKYDIDKIIELYKQGIKITHIAKQFNCNHGAIRYLLQRHTSYNNRLKSTKLK